MNTTSKTAQKAAPKAASKTASAAKNHHADAGASKAEQPQSDRDRIEVDLENVVRLGRMWARYGLEAGSNALKASSASLAVTSKLLQTLSDTVDPQTKPQR